MDLILFLIVCGIIMYADPKNKEIIEQVKRERETKK